MAKLFAIPKTRTPRSAESDAARLEAKRVFEKLAVHGEPPAVPEIVTPQHVEPTNHELDTAKEEAVSTEVSLIIEEASSAMMDVTPTTMQPILYKPSETISHQIPFHEAMGQVDTDIAMSQITERAQLAPESNQQVPTKQAPVLSTEIVNPVEHSSISSILGHKEYFERSTYSQPKRQQITIYPKAEVMQRLKSIRFTENIGSSIIIEAALDEYLARFSDQTIGELMRAQGHHLRKAKPTNQGQ